MRLLRSHVHVVSYFPNCDANDIDNEYVAPL